MSLDSRGSQVWILGVPQARSIESVVLLDNDVTFLGLPSGSEAGSIESVVLLDNDDVTVLGLPSGWEAVKSGQYGMYYVK